jgi:hypothetical protein
MKTILLKLIEAVGHWLHGITGTQFDQVLAWVKQAEDTITTGGADKLAWVKQQLATALQSDAGKALFANLSQRGLNWLIETAVGYLLA